MRLGVFLRVKRVIYELEIANQFKLIRLSALKSPSGLIHLPSFDG